MTNRPRLSASTWCARYRPRSSLAQVLMKQHRIPAPNTDSAKPISVEAPTNFRFRAGRGQLIRVRWINRFAHLGEWDAPADPYVTNGGRTRRAIQAPRRRGLAHGAFCARPMSLHLLRQSKTGVSLTMFASVHAVHRRCIGLGDIVKPYSSQVRPRRQPCQAAHGYRPAGAILLEGPIRQTWILRRRKSGRQRPTRSRRRRHSDPRRQTRRAHIELRTCQAERRDTHGLGRSTRAITNRRRKRVRRTPPPSPALLAAMLTRWFSIWLRRSLRATHRALLTLANLEAAAECGQMSRPERNDRANSHNRHAPGRGQYRVLANGSAVNGSATFSSGYNIRLDTATADTGYIPYKIELEGTATFFALNWSFVKAKTGASGDDAVNVVPVSLSISGQRPPTVPSTTSTRTRLRRAPLTGHDGWMQAVPATDGTRYGSRRRQRMPCWRAQRRTRLRAENGRAGQNFGGWSGRYQRQQWAESGDSLAYQRATSTPSVPASTLTYTFATGVLERHTGAWTQYVPSGSNPIYVTTAVAISSGATDTIATGEWSTPQIHAQMGQNGTNGTNGTNGAGYGGTSSTFNTIGTGSKTFYIGTGYAYQVGTRVRVASSSPPSNWVEGIVTAYSSGSLTLTSDITGAPVLTRSWTVTVAATSANGCNGRNRSGR